MNNDVNAVIITIIITNYYLTLNINILHDSLKQHIFL